MSDVKGKEYNGISKVSGPLLFIDDVRGIGFDEVVEIRTKNNETRHGRVLSINRSTAVVEVFEGTGGLTISGTNVKFQGKSMQMVVSMGVSVMLMQINVFSKIVELCIMLLQIRMLLLIVVKLTTVFFLVTALKTLAHTDWPLLKIL